MLHQTVNCILVVALIVLVIVCWTQQPKQHEGYFNYTRLSEASGPFHAQPTPPFDTSVFSSMPPQREDNSSWTFATPFQSACMSGTDPKPCAPCSQFTCYLTPHNQRKCSWGSPQ